MSSTSNDSSTLSQLFHVCHDNRHRGLHLLVHQTPRNPAAVDEFGECISAGFPFLAGLEMPVTFVGFECTTGTRPFDVRKLFTNVENIIERDQITHSLDTESDKFALALFFHDLATNHLGIDF